MDKQKLVDKIFSNKKHDYACSWCGHQAKSKEKAFILLDGDDDFSFMQFASRTPDETNGYTVTPIQRCTTTISLGCVNCGYVVRFSVDNLEED